MKNQAATNQDSNTFVEQSRGAYRTEGGVSFIAEIAESLSSG